ncbi:hypothetical protein OF83DRAFT_1178345 [Amylostereum chailletii]|nr:hypothetical protein OF83DRAFT_1178345 [Amylostereum chailletii]
MVERLRESESEVNLFGVFNFVRPSLVHLKKANGYIVASSSVGAQHRNPLGSDYSISKHALGRLVEFCQMGKLYTIIYSQLSSKHDAMITEYPEIKTFALHPGGVRTQLAVDAKLDPTVELDDPPEKLLLRRCSILPLGMLTGSVDEYIVLENPTIKAFTLHPGSIATRIAEEAGVLGIQPTPDGVELPAAVTLNLTSGKVDWLNGWYVSANWDFDEVEKVWKQKIIEGDALVNKLYIP